MTPPSLSWRKSARMGLSLGPTQLGPSHSHSLSHRWGERRARHRLMCCFLQGLSVHFLSWVFCASHHGTTRLPAPLTSCGVQLIGGSGKSLRVDMFLLPLSWLPSPHIPVCLPYNSLWRWLLSGDPSPVIRVLWGSHHTSSSLSPSQFLGQDPHLCKQSLPLALAF